MKSFSFILVATKDKNQFNLLVRNQLECLKFDSMFHQTKIPKPF